jgi:hypothetical protein
VNPIVFERLHKLPDGPDRTGWEARHLAALVSPEAEEVPIVQMLTGWLQYEHTHVQKWDAPIGEATVFGPVWFEIGENLALIRNGWEEAVRGHEIEDREADARRQELKDRMKAVLKALPTDIGPHAKRNRT